MALQAILFDMDGTLSETEGLHLKAFNRAFAAAKLGWHWDRTTYRELLSVKGGRDRIHHYLCRERLFPEAERQAMADDLHRAKKVYFDDACDEGANLRPGVARLIAEARARRIRVALVTAASAPTAARILAMLPGISEGDFDALVTGDLVDRNKPAPDLYQLALKRLNLPAGACVAVEDCPRGLAAAHGAGIPTLITVSEYGVQGPFTEACLVVSDLGEPDCPCQVIAGAPLAKGIVNVDGLMRYCPEFPASPV